MEKERWREEQGWGKWQRRGQAGQGRAGAGGSGAEKA